MTRIEYLLTCLSEECDEVGQRASKAARFGISEKQRDQELDNWERINLELADLCAVIELLEKETGRDFDPLNPYLMDKKKEKLEKYMQYSKDLGIIKD